MKTIREKIVENWETALKTISIANGYENDVGKVERFRSGSMDQQENIILEIKQGRELPVEGPLHSERKILTIHTILKVRHDPSVDLLSSDTVMNALEADLYKAVMVDITRGSLAEDTVFDSSGDSELDEATGRVSKVVDFSIIYRHALGDMTSA